jgi:peptidoglycan DL-endopeptidase CwlO
VLHQQRPNGTWFVTAARKVDAKGTAAVAVRPTATTNYRYMLAGNAVVNTSYSRFIRIAVASKGLAVVAEAQKHLGKPYRYGAAGPYAFDCSGLVKYVFGRFGRNLPHGATAQSKHGYGVSKAAARPGDVLLFGGGGRYGHAAIFVGNGMMIDAYTSGKPVTKRRIYSQGYIVRRMI